MREVFLVNAQSADSTSTAIPFSKGQCLGLLGFMIQWWAARCACFALCLLPVLMVFGSGYAFASPAYVSPPPKVCPLAAPDGEELSAVSIATPLELQYCILREAFFARFSDIPPFPDAQFWQGESPRSLAEITLRQVEASTEQKIRYMEAVLYTKPGTPAFAALLEPLFHMGKGSQSVQVVTAPEAVVAMYASAAAAQKDGYAGRMVGSEGWGLIHRYSEWYYYDDPEETHRTITTYGIRVVQGVIFFFDLQYPRRYGEYFSSIPGGSLEGVTLPLPDGTGLCDVRTMYPTYRVDDGAGPYSLTLSLEDEPKDGQPRCIAELEHQWHWDAAKSTYVWETSARPVGAWGPFSRFRGMSLDALEREYEGRLALDPDLHAHQEKFDALWQSFSKRFTPKTMERLANFYQNFRYARQLVAYGACLRQRDSSLVAAAFPVSIKTFDAPLMRYMELVTALAEKPDVRLLIALDPLPFDMRGQWIESYDSQDWAQDLEYITSSLPQSTDHLVPWTDNAPQYNGEPSSILSLNSENTEAKVIYEACGPGNAPDVHTFAMAVNKDGALWGTAAFEGTLSGYETTRSLRVFRIEAGVID